MSNEPQLIKDTSAIDVHLWSGDKLFCGTIRIDKERLSERLIMFNKPFVLVKVEPGWVSEYHYQLEARLEELPERQSASKRDRD